MKITKHALERAKQSGLSKIDLFVIIKCGSFTLGKRNRRCYSIQTEADQASLLAHLLTTTGVIATEAIKRLMEAMVIISKDGWVITAFTTNLNNNTQITQKPFEVMKGG